MHLYKSCDGGQHGRHDDERMVSKYNTKEEGRVHAHQQCELHHRQEMRTHPWILKEMRWLRAFRFLLCWGNRYSRILTKCHAHVARIDQTGPCIL